MKKTTKTVSELIEDGGLYPFPLSVIPNNMGINLSSVDNIVWETDDNESIKSITINFLNQ